MVSSSSLRLRRAEQRARWPLRGERALRPLALLVVLVTVTVVVGWLTGVHRLTEVAPGQRAMKLNTAVAFLFLATAHLTRVEVARRLQLLVPLVIALVTGAEYLFRVDLGIDQLVVQGDLADRFPGRMAEGTVLCLVLLPVAALLVTSGRLLVAQIVVVPALIVGMVAIYGYAYGVEALSSFGPFSTISIPTAFCAVLCSLVVLLSVPQGALQWIAFGEDPGAAVQRLLVPLAVVALPVGGWFRVQGQIRGYYDARFGTALMVALVGVTLIFIGLVGGRAAARIDAQREGLIDELNAVNADLEERIRVRSLQLNRQRTKLALLDERDRIARDLHDRVIQRIFAAGLQVSALNRSSLKVQAGAAQVDDRFVDGLQTVATELDLAIRELRNSIFELTSIADHDDVEQVIRDVVTRASRILGFMPKISVTGQVSGLPEDLVAHIATVVQESLSNVARHAHAGEAEVAFHADDDEVVVTVTDDGVGMPSPLPRSSGVSNLLNRARTLGGSSTWTAREPHGTVLTWRVPREIVDDDDLMLREAQGRPTPLPAPVPPAPVEPVVEPAASDVEEPVLVEEDRQPVEP